MNLRIQSTSYIESKYVNQLEGFGINSNHLFKINIESMQEERFILQIPEKIQSMCICQLPNDDIFCYSNRVYSGKGQNYQLSGITFIIKSNNEIKLLKEGLPCWRPCAAYYDGAVYVFGGICKTEPRSHARKFIINQNKWIIFPEPKFEVSLHDSCIEFQGFILVAGYFDQTNFLFDTFNETYNQLPANISGNSEKLIFKKDDCAFLVNSNREVFQSEYKNPFVWHLIFKCSVPNMKLAFWFQLLYYNAIYFVIDKRLYRFYLERKEIVQLKLTRNQ